MGSLLVYNWPHSIGQNHFFVMMPLNRDFSIKSASRRFCTVYKSEKSDPLQPFERRDIPSRRPTVQSIIRLDDGNFPSGPSSVSRSFELFQLTSVRTFQQHVWTTLSVRPATGFLSKTQIWEVPCNCPDDVKSRLDAFIHKASIAFKIQTVRMPVFMARPREHQIWKLRASDQSTRRPFPWSGRTKP